MCCDHVWETHGTFKQCRWCSEIQPTVPPEDTIKVLLATFKAVLARGPVGVE